MRQQGWRRGTGRRRRGSAGCGRRSRRWPGGHTGSSWTRKGTTPPRMWRGGRRPGKGPERRKGRLGRRGGSGAGPRSGEQGEQRGRHGLPPQPGAGTDGLGLGVATAAAVCAAAGTEGARDGRGVDGGGRGRAGPLHEVRGEDEGRTG